MIRNTPLHENLRGENSKAEPCKSCFGKKLSVFEKEKTGQCGWNRENKEKAVKTEIREGRKHKSKMALFIVKWNLNCILSATGKHWRILIKKFAIRFVF